MCLLLNEEHYIFLIIIGFIVVVFLVLRWYEKRRTQQFQESGANIGFFYTPELEDNIITTSRFNLFQIGHSKKAYNILKGAWDGVSWTLFEYKYTTGHGKHAHTYNQTVAYSDSVSMDFPDFSLGPEYFFYKIAGDLFRIAKFKDIDIETHPNFFKNYLLKGSDEQAIRSLFQPHILSFFEAKSKGIHIQARGHKFLYYRLSRRINPKELTNFLQEVSEVLRIFG